MLGIDHYLYNSNGWRLPFRSVIQECYLKANLRFFYQYTNIFKTIGSSVDVARRDLTVNDLRFAAFTHFIYKFMKCSETWTWHIQTYSLWVEKTLLSRFALNEDEVQCFNNNNKIKSLFTALLRQRTSF